MIEGKRILAIIPARAGSKGLPGKNMRELLGKPLITWTIDVAKGCPFIDFIYLSTDSEVLADIGKAEGLIVPALRPEILATDSASSIDVVVHSIQESIKITQLDFDIVILLEPTSPLRDVEDISDALKRLIENKKAKAITGVSKVEDQHPDFLVSLGPEGFQLPYLKEGKSWHKRRQDISELFFHEGSFYMSYVDYFLKNRTFYSSETLGHVLPKWKSLEVDDIYDFIMVEAIMKKKILGEL